MRKTGAAISSSRIAASSASRTSCSCVPKCTHCRLRQGVPEKEVVVGDADGVEACLELRVREEIGALDQAELVDLAAAGEQGRDGEEKVVDQAFACERGEEPRAGLAEDALVAALVEELDRSARVDDRVAGDDRDLGRRL